MQSVCGTFSGRSKLKRTSGPSGEHGQRGEIICFSFFLYQYSCQCVNLPVATTLTPLTLLHYVVLSVSGELQSGSCAQSAVLCGLGSSAKLIAGAHSVLICCVSNGGVIVVL